MDRGAWWAAVYGVTQSWTRLKQLSSLAARELMDFAGGSNGKESVSSAEDLSSIRGLGRSPGEGKGNPLQYACLENPWTEKPGGLQSMGSRRVGHD